MEKERDALKAEAERIPTAVLAYSTNGHNKPCGQTMGANGAGDFALLLYGPVAQVDKVARDHIRALETGGYRFNSVTLVFNEDGYYGPLIKIVDAALQAEKEKRS